MVAVTKYVLSVNKTKYKIFYNVYIQKKDPNIMSPPVLYLHDKQLSLQTKPIKYLGYNLSYNLNQMYHINYLIKRANYSFSSVRSGLKYIKHVNMKTYILIIKVCVIPIITYCDIFLQVTTKAEIKVLQTFYNKILRFLCGGRLDTPTDPLILFTPYGTIKCIIDQHAAQYWENCPFPAIIRYIPL